MTFGKKNPTSAHELIIDDVAVERVAEYRCAWEESVKQDVMML